MSVGQPSSSEAKPSFTNIPFHVFNLCKAWIPNLVSKSEPPTYSANLSSSPPLPQPLTPCFPSLVSTTQRVLLKGTGSFAGCKNRWGVRTNQSAPPHSLPRPFLRKEMGCRCPSSHPASLPPKQNFSVLPFRTILDCWF